MEFQSAVFPAPQSSYTAEDNVEELIYVPRFGPARDLEAEERKEEGEIGEMDEHDPFCLPDSIPCMLFRHSPGSSKVMLYFHGNAEDVGLTAELLEHLGPALKIHIIAVEYPGYGIYRTKEPSETQILADAQRVYDYFTQDMGYPEKNILVFGRSIGSGPATYVASERNPGILCLMSPFRSIKDVVHTLVGKWAKWMIADRFNNLKRMEEVDCPLLVIHGLKDTLIPKSHAEDLHSRAKNIS
jgi:pimeloyl-ACP methyl ester carboxylesterase